MLRIVFFWHAKEDRLLLFSVVNLEPMGKGRSFSRQSGRSMSAFKVQRKGLETTVEKVVQLSACRRKFPYLF